MKRKLYLPILLVILTIQLYGQVDTIRYTPDLIDGSTLPIGTNRYMVHMVLDSQRTMDLSLWERSVRQVTFQDQQMVEVTQRWHNQSESKGRMLYSLNELKGFLPRHHYAKNGSGQVDAYDFSERAITGCDTVAENTKLDFKRELTGPTLNFELDLELLQLLPYREGVVFAIPFYHPGSKTEVKDYYYEVLGKESLTIPGSCPVDCWKVRVTYAEGSYATFWLSESDGSLIKMEEVFGKITRSKVRVG